MATKRIVVEAPWNPDTKMESYMVDAMLDDTICKTGTEEDMKVRAAVKEWATGILNELPNDHSLTLGEMEGEALAFSSGFEAGLKAH